MKRLLNLFSILVLGMTISLSAAALAPAQSVSACGGDPGFFALPTWHQYLPCDDNGDIQIDIDAEGNGLNSLWLIGVAVLEIILALAGLIAMAFVIWGGYGYISAQGQPDKAANARKTIFNALIGLTIVIMSTIAVRFFIRLLGGDGITTQTGGINVPSPDTGGTVIGEVLGFVYAVAAGVALINIVIGGMKFMLSNGDSTKAANARNTVIYAAVGLVIVLGASIITNTILDRIN